ncbi:MAG: hypothetical protein COC03_06720 [Robiginitomaculum sp.]|nr:MAG: hypothetical protein COC03_06720 [Robiginitomaculum sp.]
MDTNMKWTLCKILFLLFVIIVLAGIAHTFLYTKKWEDAHPPTGKFKMVNGYKLHYRDINRAPDSKLTPIVLIHGASANFLDMKIALGDRLSENRRIILVDRPGHGYSERPKDGYLLNVQTRQINGLIKKLDVEKPIIIGQSYGGAVALKYAINYPDDVSGLVILAGVSHPWPGGVASHYSIGAGEGLGTLFRWTLFPALGEMKGPEFTASIFWPKKPPRNYHDRAAIGLLYRPKEFKNNAQDITHLLKEVNAMKSRYKTIAVPVKILAGTQDTIVSPTIHARTLGQQIPNAHFEFVPDTGHTLQHSATQEIDAMLAELDEELSIEVSEELAENLDAELSEELDEELSEALDENLDTELSEELDEDLTQGNE